jgi:sulfate permease, SulP family
VTVFQNVDIRRIGEIPVGLPTLQLPTFTPGQITIMLVDGVMLGMLGCIDTLLTAVVADSLTRTEHKSDKELIGQGIGNIVSGVCGGLPGAGATMGTVVNIQTGATSALSGLTRALVLLVVVLGAAKLTQPIPMAVLAGIALKVGIDILDWSFLKRSHQVSIKGSLIMYGVLLLTVFVDLIVAVGVGVFIANILTIERLSNLQAKEVKLITDTDDDDVRLSSEQKQLLDKGNGRVLLFYLSGPMIFGLSKAIAREHNAMKDADALVMDLSDVPILGVTASLAIENAIRDAYDKGLQVYIVGASSKIQSRLEKLGIFSLIKPDHVLTDRTAALRQAVDLVYSKEVGA